MAQNTPTNSIPNITPSDIKTYGALILPFDKDEVLKKTQVQAPPKVKTTFKGQLKSALGLSSDPTFKDMLKNPGQTFETLAEYTKDTRLKISGIINDVESKFSGIALTQAIINGRITSQEALDYLFMGFAPALGVQGSLMGYSGLNQMKDALFNGTINVGSFISGFTRTLKGMTDLKDLLTKKKTQVAGQVIEFDLTVSHSENYQSETPDRRVQSGQSLQEYVHNLPETFDVQCALQEGKRYSKAEFRAILLYLRDRKETVQLILGDEIFDSLILTAFNPSHDCTKSGMDYTLSFKKVNRSDVQTNAEVNIVKIPVDKLRKELENNSAGSTGSLKTQGRGNIKNTKNITNAKVNIKSSPTLQTMDDVAQSRAALKSAGMTINDVAQRIQLYQFNKTFGLN